MVFICMKAPKRQIFESIEAVSNQAIHSRDMYRWSSSRLSKIEFDQLPSRHIDLAILMEDQVRYGQMCERRKEIGKFGPCEMCGRGLWPRF